MCVLWIWFWPLSAPVELLSSPWLLFGLQSLISITDKMNANLAGRAPTKLALSLAQLSTDVTNSAHCVFCPFVSPPELIWVWILLVFQCGRQCWISLFLLSSADQLGDDGLQTARRLGTVLWWMHMSLHTVWFMFLSLRSLRVYQVWTNQQNWFSHKHWPRREISTQPHNTLLSFLSSQSCKIFTGSPAADSSSQSSSSKLWVCFGGGENDQ